MFRGTIGMEIYSKETLRYSVEISPWSDKDGDLNVSYKMDHYQATVWMIIDVFSLPSHQNPALGQ